VRTTSSDRTVGWFKVDELLLNDLTLNFDPFTINVLKSEFIERDGEISINDFIMIIKDHLIHWQLDISNRETKLIRCLYLLFNDIDLNGNGQMDWDEFTNYIIEKAAVLNTMKNRNEEIKSYHQTEMRLWFRPKTIEEQKEAKDFFPGGGADKKKFKEIIAKCIYIEMPGLRKIAFFEEGTDVVQFADPLTGEVDPDMNLHVEVTRHDKKQDALHPADCNAKRAMLLDMLFIPEPKFQLLMTSSNDGIIRMFKFNNKGFMRADDSNQRDSELNLQTAQIIIVWDSLNEILYSGQRDGLIRIWEQKSVSVQ
jgi:hypothetical protein